MQLNNCYNERKSTPDEIYDRLFEWNSKIPCRYFGLADKIIFVYPIYGFRVLKIFLPLGLDCVWIKPELEDITASFYHS